MFDLDFRKIILRKGEIKIIKFCLRTYIFSEIITENFGPTTRVIILNRLLYPPRASKAPSAVSVIPTLSMSIS